MDHRKFNYWLLKFFIIVLFVLLFPVVVFAQTGLLPGETLEEIKYRPVDISASVPAAPSSQVYSPESPILINPENESTLSSGRVEFYFELQEHDYSYTRLELSIDGETVYDDISVLAEETNDYILRVDNRKYWLKLKSHSALSDGLHSWKVRAIDSNNNGKDSATWTFSIDSTPPQIVLTEVGNQSVSISSEDSTTMPAEALIVNSARPKIIGVTDPYATVLLTVFYADWLDRDELKVSADVNGVFGFDLPGLTDGQAVLLTFVAIDLAQNTIVLEDVPVLYQVPKITVSIFPPGLFPNPPVIKLPTWPALLQLPVIRLPAIPEPIREVVKPIEPVFEPAVVWTDQLATLIQENLWWLQATILVTILLYVWFYHLLTDNKLIYYPRLAGWFLRRWLRVNLKQDNQFGWHDLQTGIALPGFAFQLESFDQTKRTISKKKIISGLFGEFVTSVSKSDTINSASVQNKRWHYPVQSNFDKIQGDQVNINGQSWWVNDQKVTPATNNEQEIILLPDRKDYQVYLWAQSLRKWPDRWQYLPRLVLILGWLLTLLLLIWKTQLDSILLVLLISYFLVRDFQWQLPAKWQIYTANLKKKTD